MKNGHKNGLKKGNKPTQFTSENQPSPEAKKKGWDRRHMKEEIMDKVCLYLSWDIARILATQKQIEHGGGDFTVLDKKVIDYILDNRNTIDLFNRAVPYAPKEIDLTSKGEALQGVSPELKAIALDLTKLLNDTKSTQHTEGEGNSKEASS